MYDHHLPRLPAHVAQRLSCVTLLTFSSASQQLYYHLRLWTHNSHLAIDGHGSVEDAMHAQDGRLWGVNDGRAKQGAKHATVADGEGASIHIFNSKLIFTSLRHTTQNIFSLS